MRRIVLSISLIAFIASFLLLLSQPPQSHAFTHLRISAAARRSRHVLLEQQHYHSQRKTITGVGVIVPTHRRSKFPAQGGLCTTTRNDDDDDKTVLSEKEENSSYSSTNAPPLPPINVVRGFDQDEISDEMWENVETGEPPKWVVMKELLGINIFTYVLAALIVAFLTANFFLGPGWLGQAIGMKGTGTFTDVSPSLPDTVDLNDPNFLL